MEELIRIGVFILLLAVNALQIFGFFQATNYEYEPDKLEFDAEIKKGKLKVLGKLDDEWIVYATIEAPDPNVPLTQHFSVRIPHEIKEVKFETDSGTDTDINILNYQRIEKIDEDSKQIFWWIRFYAKKWLGDYLCKPVACCPVCMVSLHSLWIWILVYNYFEFSLVLLYIHAIYMLCLCGLNKFLMIKYEMD